MKTPAAEIETPLGKLRIVVVNGKVCAAEWTDCWDRVAPSLERRFGGLEPVRSKETMQPSRALGAYFHGELDAVDALAVDTGGTPFQRSVWRELRKIEAGATVSYGELAHAIGRPGACRAVGSANGSNPVAVILPCHRVIRTDGGLGGYGGGLPRKEWLLRHEGAML